MSLYLKYRPQTFENLVGQDHVRTILKNALDRDLVAHAYLFCGPRGTGKTSTARLLAKALNCEKLSEDFEPCNECGLCKSINESSLIDVIEIDAASNRGIDEIRELRETIKFAPSIAKNKIYIIDEVHMLTNEAFNALLKTLEEPPANVFFILATTEVHKIPTTVMSRCQRFDFKRLNRDIMFDRLKEIADKEKIEYDDEALRMIAEHVDGGLRDAIGLLDQLSVSGKITSEITKNLIGSTGMETLEKFLARLIAKDERSALAVVEELYNEGYELKQFMQDLMKLVREKMHEAINSGDNSGKIMLLQLIEQLNEVMEVFKNPIVPQVPLEVLVVKYCNDTSVVVSTSPVTTQQEPTPPSPIKSESKPEPGLTSVPIEKPATKPKAELPPKKFAPATVATSEPKAEKKPEPQIEEKSDVKPAEAPSNDKPTDITSGTWDSLLKKVNKPTLRRSLEQGRFSPGNNGEAELIFTSMFHFNAVNTAEHLKIAEDLLNELTNQSIRLVLKKEDAPADPVKNSAATENDTPTPKPVQTMAADDLANFFGGELV